MTPKKLLRSLAAFALLAVARAVLVRYKPKIIMITGSVGKTSTKDAVAAVFSSRFYLRASAKSFNSEFGVPFTILGVDNPWGNPVAWAAVAKAAFALLILPNHYPNWLVLEVGADAPGDLARILRIARPDAVVVTRLPDIPVHVEFYATPEDVREEEFSPAYALLPGTPLIVSADDANALSRAETLPARLLTYGFDAESAVRLSRANWHTKAGKVAGMRADVSLADERGELVVRGSAGRVQLLPPAAAIAAGHAFGIPLAEALAALAAYEPPAGRGRLFTGLEDSVIIDDSYNASPAAVEEALAALASFPRGKGRRIAVLGDMLELGRYSVMEHERIGTHAAEATDMLITVGVRAQGIARGARAAGLNEVESFGSAQEAGAFLRAHIRKGDVVLVKGSQNNIRLERLVADLLADPSDRARLVRQDKEWQKR